MLTQISSQISLILKFIYNIPQILCLTSAACGFVEICRNFAARITLSLAALLFWIRNFV